MGKTTQDDCREWPISSTEDARSPIELLEQHGPECGGEAVAMAEQSGRIIEGFLMAWWAILPTALLILAVAIGAHAVGDRMPVDLLNGHFDMHRAILG